MTYPRPIDVFEATVNSALTSFWNDIKDGHSRTPAERAARDKILKAWMRGQTAEQAIRRARAQLDQMVDPPAVTRRRRAELDDARSQAHVAAIRRGREKSTA